MVSEQKEDVVTGEESKKTTEKEEKDFGIKTSKGSEPGTDGRKEINVSERYTKIDTSTEFYIRYTIVEGENIEIGNESLTTQVGGRTVVVNLQIIRPVRIEQVCLKN